MDVQDFFYLKSYDSRYIQKLLKKLISLNILKNYIFDSETHYFELKINIDDLFLKENHIDLDHISYVDLVKRCIYHYENFSPLSNIMDRVRIESSYYPKIKDSKVSITYDNLLKRVYVTYHLVLMIVPDHL